MIVVCFLMLVPFYWVIKTSLTGENIYAWPPRIVPSTRISSTMSTSGT
jgi:ABC-type glycerol-3-phosphate transport system permease component